MEREIGVNTLVFQEKMQEGTARQHEYFEELKEMGFRFIEIRREYLRDFDAELAETAAKARQLNLDLYYSVPSSLFLEKKLNPELEQYFSEAEILHAHQVKLTLGERPIELDETFQKLAGLLSQFEEISLSIENDQTLEAGSAEGLARFMVEASPHKLPLRLTFDTGNFIYIGENPEEAAYILRDFTGYIHLKNVAIPDADRIELALYDTGIIKMGNVLDAFRTAVPAAIEYPCGSDKEATRTLRAELEKIKQS